MTLKIYIIDKSRGTHQELRNVKGRNKIFSRRQWIGRKEKSSSIKKIGIGFAAIIMFLTSFLPAEASIKLQKKLKTNLNISEIKEKIDYKKLGFDSKIQSKLHLLKTLENLTIKNIDSKWSHNDKVMFGNFIKLANDDISQTINKQKAPNREYDDKTWTEGDINPFVAPLVKNPNLFRTLGFVGDAYLADRWEKMNNPTQRSFEILLANLVEAGFLQYSQEPWRLTFGVNFNA